MQVKTIKTAVLMPPKDNLLRAVRKSIRRIPERSVLVIASKVVSIHQGRCILRTKVKHKDKLIQREADKYLPREFVPNRHAVLTVKHNVLIPTAGIDESNAGEYYILWPRSPEKTAKDLCRFLKRVYTVRELGVIIADSHTVPLRRGVLGIALAYYGFRPINDYRGTKDIFGRKFKVSTVNVADGLAVAGVLAMGEGTERTPLALITHVPFVHFTNRPYRPTKKYSSWKINWKEDLYGPLLHAVKWKKK